LFIKQGVALTGRNRTGLPCIVGRPTAHAPGGRQRYIQRQTTPTDDITNKYVRPRKRRSTLLKLEKDAKRLRLNKDGTDGRTDGRQTDASRLTL